MHETVASGVSRMTTTGMAVAAAVGMAVAAAIMACTAVTEASSCRPFAAADKRIFVAVAAAEHFFYQLHGLPLGLAGRVAVWRLVRRPRTERISLPRPSPRPPIGHSTISFTVPLEKFMLPDEDAPPRIPRLDTVIPELGLFTEKRTRRKAKKRNVVLLPLMANDLRHFYEFKPNY
eukprot:g24137.t1